MANDAASRRSARRRALLAAATSVVLTMLSFATNLATNLVPDTWAWARDLRLVGGTLLGLAAVAAVLAAWSPRPEPDDRSDRPPQLRPVQASTQRATTAISQQTGMLAGGIVTGQVGTVVNYFPPVSPASGSSETEPSDRTDEQPHVRVWNIPPPVRTFTGRTSELAELHQELMKHRAAVVVPAAALWGIGGIGKTQLARAYAQTHRDDYQVGWWIPAATQLEAIASLTELAVALGASEDLLPERAVADLHRRLADEPHRWLLIFDNASGPADLQPLLPTAGDGRILITSRNPAWHEVAQPVGMPALDEDAAVLMLLDRTGQTDQEAAGRLAEVLGHLPLALEQAGSYADQHHLPLADYQALFEERRTDLLDRGAPLAYEGTVAATVTLAIDQLPTDPPASRWLLEVCALLAPDQLPVSRLLSRPDLLPDVVQAGAADPLARAEAPRVLYQAGLLTPDVNGTARLHRLTQAVVLDTLTGSNRCRRLAQTIHLLKGLFPDEAYLPTTWPICADLIAHVSALLNHVEPASPANEALATLLTKAGTYLAARGTDLNSASRLYQGSLVACL